MRVDLSPSCRAELFPWGSGGMSVLLRVGLPEGVRMAAMVCPVGDAWWSRAGVVPAGLRDPLRPFSPYGGRIPLEDVVSWAASFLSLGAGESASLDGLLRREGLLEALLVMES